MSKENKAISRRFYQEVFSRGDLDVADSLLAADCVDHNPPGPGFSPGREGVKQVVTMLRAAVPDLKVTVEDQIAEGDKVASRLTVRGTQQGELMSVPPTGKSITVGLVDIFRIEDGLILERWGEADLLGMMQQLGVVPEPGQAR